MLVGVLRVIIKAFYPNYFSYKRIAYVCLAIAEGLSRLGVKITVYGNAAEKGFKHDLYKSVFNRAAALVAYRVLPIKLINKISEMYYLRQLNRKDIAYLWPGVSISTIKKIKKIGCIVITENINTHTKSAKDILSAEYNRLGIGKFNEITDEMIEYENAVHMLSDYIFSPSKAVTISLQESGVNDNKILESSYGWSGNNIYSTFRTKKENNSIKVLFIATLCVRKGMHLLVDIWEKAKINGTLVVAGRVHDQYITNITEKFFKREDVEFVGYADDIKKLNAMCDIFILPSLEEGDPLVTYEAMAAGLPVIVSPMGAGRSVRDNIDGFIIDPHDIESWIIALRKLASDKSLYEKMSNNAQERAHDYTWDKVAKQRYDIIIKNLDRKEAKLLY